MTRYALVHNDAPSMSLSLTVNVNVNADKFLLLLVGVVWWTMRQAATTAGDIRQTAASFVDDITTMGKIVTILSKSILYGLGI